MGFWQSVALALVGAMTVAVFIYTIAEYVHGSDFETPGESSNESS